MSASSDHRLLHSQTHIRISWNRKVPQNTVWETLIEREVSSGMPQGSIPGPSRLAFSMNNLEEGIDCLLINSAGSLDPGDMENALGDISSLQRYLDMVKKWFKITVCSITRMSRKPYIGLKKKKKKRLGAAAQRHRRHR